MTADFSYFLEDKNSLRSVPPKDARRFVQLANELEDEEKTLREVAESVAEPGTSESSLRNTITTLDKLAGCQLVQYREVKKPMGEEQRASLTLAGSAFLTVCIARLEQDLGFRIRTGHVLDVRMRVVSHHMFNTFLLPPAIAALLKSFGEETSRIAFEVRDAAYGTGFLNEIADDRADLAIDSPSSRLTDVFGVEVERVECEPLGRVVLVPASAGKAEIALLEKDRVSYEDLTKVRLCYVHNNDLSNALPPSNLPRVQVDTLAAVRSFVKAGFVGISINWKALTEPASEMDSGFVVKWIEPSAPASKLNAPLTPVVMHRSGPGPSLMRQLIEAVKAEFLNVERHEVPADIVESWRRAGQ
jgi:DNA-binding transcriptional LysR family regulator